MGTRVNSSPRLLSIVLPLYNEQEVLPLLRDRLEKLTPRLPCPVEWILVNDGSRDATGRLLFDWARADPRARVVDLSRNFGHQAAVTAGVDHAAGDAVVIMDADLQDPPELVLEMLKRLAEGFDVVYAQRTRRHGEGIFKRATAKAFYWLMRRFVHPDLPPDTGDFRLMSRSAVEALAHLREGQRFLRGMVTWVGFRQTTVQFERPPRAAGETKYPLRKMIRFAWTAILSFSSLPLHLSTYLGLAVFVFGIAYGAYALVQAIIFHDVVTGWTSIIVLQAVLGGAILVCLGMIGEYVARIYDEIKRRPIYIVRETANWRERPLPSRGVAARGAAASPEAYAPDSSTPPYARAP